MKNSSTNSFLLLSGVLGIVLSPVAGAQAPPIPRPATPEAPAPAAGDDYLPEPFNPQEHASTWSNPPFSRRVLPDVIDAPADIGPAPWDGWQIAAVDQFGGSFTVGLVTKKNEFRLIKEGEMNEEEGVQVTKVESNGVITDTIVHVSDGNRTGTITFESKRLTVATKGAPAAPKNQNQNRRTAPTRQQAATPQQRAAEAAANRQAQVKMAAHLNAAANAKPAAGAAQPAAAAAQPAAPQPTSRTRRRQVVLPPSTR